MPNGFEARECHALSITQKIQLRSSVVDPVTPLLMLCVYITQAGDRRGLRSRRGPALRHYARMQKDQGSIRFGSPFSSKNCGSWTQSCDFVHTVNETIKCLPQLPALMQSHSGGDSVANRWKDIGTHPPTSPCP